MANRGRGRGRSTMSISTEQLGFGKGEALPPPVLQPPAKFPHLDHKPIPFELNNEMSYLLEIKRDIAEYHRESPYNVQSIVVKKDIERYSDRYQDIVNDKVHYEERYSWLRLPVELKSGVRKRKIDTTNDAGFTPIKITKPKKEVDIDKKFKELEQKENIRENSNVEEDDKANEDADEKDQDNPAEEEEEEEVDEEMDDGTDYVNNYFDNGEGYDDEDDNLDDGPIY